MVYVINSKLLTLKCFSNDTKLWLFQKHILVQGLGAMKFLYVSDDQNQSHPSDLVVELQCINASHCLMILKLHQNYAIV